ncbi:hypothetical protein [Flavobacterium wongokense]|uniref:hypothetical protein n=1 Tax=Flavobacterium wongokense TaxID=2910674 RepID=UPI001F4151F0|nr:hypothetical protein [Flavobacterium sp. WG47]MCF6132088.1 hypothetical protein [Flavobacterium sp. WG47]
MKKLIVLLLISGAVYSQSVTKKETINKLLCKTWIADYAMMNNKKIQKMGQMKTLTYTFKTDHTYTANEKISGTWSYNGKKKNIELFVNGDLKSTISILQSKKMAMVLKADVEAPVEITKIEIHFKPKA